MAQNDAQDRNLPASARKIQKAREEGQVARSRDLGHFAAMAAGAALVMAASSDFVGLNRGFLTEGLRFTAVDVTDPARMVERLSLMGWAFVRVVLPVGLAMMLAGVAAALLLGGWNWTMKPLAPSFGKMNPISGVGRMFSKAQLVETAKACVLAIVLGGVGAWFLRGQFDQFTALLHLALPAALAQAGQVMVAGLGFLLMALGLFALVDVPLQRKLHADQLKMSWQELKQEYKEMEGSPEVKSRQKQRMREVANRRMLAAVPTADVVVMNPTHFAVALKYDESSMAAPRVVAKGADLMAFRIKDAAVDARVPVLQAPMLARALYAHAEVDREIPAALFAAVAQVLAYIYRLRAAMIGRGPAPGELPDLPVPEELDPQHPKARRATARDVDDVAARPPTATP
jgi:flagellar biosynthetic protein FlhB